MVIINLMKFNPVSLFFLGIDYITNNSPQKKNLLWNNLILVKKNILIEREIYDEKKKTLIYIIYI